jgi:hypothetical protein
MQDEEDPVPPVLLGRVPIQEAGEHYLWGMGAEGDFPASGGPKIIRQLIADHDKVDRRRRVGSAALRGGVPWWRYSNEGSLTSLGGRGQRGARWLTAGMGTMARRCRGISAAETDLGACGGIPGLQ